MAGRALSAEIIKTAVKSYDAGEIGYFEYIQSIENAIQIDMEYLEYLNMYNQSVLDLNYIVH
jgi:cobalt-zinc-cadmium resistance protein CzcA